MIGKVIDNYRIINILGEGGMGIVYKGFDLKLERYIALKILNQQALRNPQFIERFKREAKNQAKLNHSNIVPVYGFTEDGGTLGIVMEYVAGETLEHLIDRKGKLELAYAIDIINQILVGVSYAHSKGFVHRDLKPSNIIINEDGIAKIMDFGISKSINEVSGITKTGAKLGTVLYMSPEQIKAQEPTLQSDIYSIGITFYEMLSGKTPFEAPTDFHIMEAHLKKNPVKLSSQFDNIPPMVDSVLAKALSKSTSRRYHSCEEFQAELNNIPVTPYKRTKKTNKKKVEKIKAKRIETSPSQLLKKVKNYFLVLFIIIVFAALIYLVYQSISGPWTEQETPVKIINNGENTYKTNPSYLTKTSWKSIDIPTTSNLNSVNFVSDSVGYACGENSTILKSINGGKTWEVMPVGESNLIFNDIKFFNVSKGLVIGEKGTILNTTDGGSSWRKVNIDLSVSLFGIYFFDNSDIGFIAGGNGTILKTINGGDTWNRVLSPSHRLLYSIAFENENTGFAVGWNGELLKSTDKGNTWTTMTSFSDVYLKDISFISNSIGIIVGGGGEIFRTENGGAVWENVSSGVIAGLYSIAFLDNKNGLILTGSGSVLVTDDSGKSWETTSSGKFGALNHIAVLPSKKVILVGVNGTILGSQD